jgi:hypothetical protein
LPFKEVKTFLLECVNLPNLMDYPDHRPYFDRWFRRWQRVLPFGEGDGHIGRDALEQFAPAAKTALRRIWWEVDPRQRDWYFYRLRDAYHHMIVPAETPNIIRRH